LERPLWIQTKNYSVCPAFYGGPDRTAGLAMEGAGVKKYIAG